MTRSIAWRISSVAVLITGMLVSTVQAQQPTVVVSLRGIDSVVDDIDFLFEEIIQAGTKATIEQFVDQVTAGKGLAGIDRKKPLGVYLPAPAADAQELPVPVAFIPVTDSDDLKELLEDLQLIEDFKEEDGQWSASLNGAQLYGKVSDGYLFISSRLPAKLADPAKIANAKYDVTLDVSLASIPPLLKEMFLDKVREEGRKNQEDNPEPATEAERVGREWGFNGTLAVLQSIVNQGDKLTLGVEIDRKGRTAASDLSLTAKDDTPLAEALTAYGKIQPAFAGLGSESAPFRMVFSMPLIAPPEQIDSLFKAMKTTANDTIDQNSNLKNDEERERAKHVAGRLLSVLQETLKSDSIQAGAVMEDGGEGTARLLAGAKVVEGDEFAESFHELIEAAKSDPGGPEIELDVAKHAGARIHSISVNDADGRKVFGDEDAHLAFRNGSVWLSLGGDNLAALKKALDAKPASKTTAAPISIRMKLAALLLLMQDEEPDEDEPLKKIAGTPGDKFNLEIVPITSGAKLRIEFGIDLLKLVNQLDD